MTDQREREHAVERLNRIKGFAEEVERATQPGDAQTCAQHIQAEVRDLLAALQRADAPGGHVMPCVNCGKPACTIEDCAESGHGDSCEAAVLHGWVCSGECWDRIAALFDDEPPTVRGVYWLAERVGVRVTHPCGAPIESWETAPHPRGCQCQNDE